MKTTTMFREAVAQIPNDVRIEVDLSFAIADKIDATLLSGLFLSDFSNKIIILLSTTPIYCIFAVAKRT